MTTYDVHQNVIDEALSWYDTGRVPEPFQQTSPRIIHWLRGHHIDWRRCTVEDDGSVIVWNGCVW